MIYGIDISKYQADKNGHSNIKFYNMRANNLEFAILRAGYGMYEHQKDIAFECHYAQAESQGIPCGAYHYSYALNTADARREAACFLKWIEGKKLYYPVAFDIEDKSQKGLPKNLKTDIALTWLEIVEKAGYYVMLYCSADWAKNHLDMDALKSFDVWLACYTSEERRKSLYSGNLGIWQFSSTHRASGVYNGNLDVNVAYKDYANIIKKKGLNGV